jgi:hypothetical protein
VKETPLTLIALLPLLVMVTVCGAEVAPLRTPPPLELTSVRLVGAIEAVACAPEPASASVGLPPLEVSASVAVSGRAGVARGVKVRVTLLWAPLAIESGLPALGTVEVMAKSPASVPEMAIPVTLSGASAETPLLVMSAVKTVLLVEPTAVGGKLLAPCQLSVATG